MKLLLIIYSGPQPDRVSELLDAAGVRGYSEFENVHGTGRTGRRKGTRAWPGGSAVFFSIVPGDCADELMAELKAEAAKLKGEERLHVAVLPTEQFI